MSSLHSSGLDGRSSANLDHTKLSRVLDGLISSSRSMMARPLAPKCLCTRSVKLSNRYRLPHGYRFSESFDAFELMHRLCGEIRLSAVRTRPHRYSFNHKKVSPTTKGPDDPPKLYARTTARGTEMPRRGRP